MNSPKDAFSGFALESLRKCLEIRLFEEALLSLYERSLLRGTTHTCIGQEYIPVAYSRHISNTDFVFSNHRGHGHFLAHTSEFELLLDEITGHESGLCKGVGGSQHLHKGRFFSNGILGGMLPIALGASYRCNPGELSCIYLGDGATAEGLFHETLNFAALNPGPLLIIIEDNKIAQSTPASMFMSGSLVDRVRSYGLTVRHFGSASDVFGNESLYEEVQSIRSQRIPQVHIHECFRLKSHSKGDDTRSESELDKIWRSDYLNLWLNSLEDDKKQELISLCKNKINALLERIEEPNKEPKVVTSNPPRKEVKENDLLPSDFVFSSTSGETYIKTLNNSMHKLFEENKDIYLFGEDINDPYGGAFKATKGLQARFSNRVRSTPISESAIAGVAIGMALEGLPAIAEIMFGDFLLLCADQLINHAGKLTSMYGKSLSIPAIIRSPVGGYRGYGPTHSQCLEKHFIGNDQLNVLALNILTPPLSIYRLAVKSGKPSLVLENKTDYGRKSISESQLSSQGFSVSVIFDSLGWPIHKVSLVGIPERKLTIVCYGGMVSIALELSERLFIEHEISVDILIPVFISRPSETLVECIKASTPSDLLFLSEGTDFGDFMRSAHSLYAQQLDVGQSHPRVFFENAKSSIIACSEEKELDILPSVDATLATLL